MRSESPSSILPIASSLQQSEKRKTIFKTTLTHQVLFLPKAIALFFFSPQNPLDMKIISLAVGLVSLAAIISALLAPAEDYLSQAVEKRSREAGGYPTRWTTTKADGGKDFEGRSREAGGYPTR